MLKTGASVISCYLFINPIEMPTNLKKSGVHDQWRIKIDEAWELRYWSNQFGVIPEILQDAVGYVGPIVKDIKEWLLCRGHIEKS